MDTSTAIIQFIGIVLFSAQIPNDPGVHAILPRITEDHHHVQMISSKTETDSENVSFVDGVEEHVAVIFYRKKDLLDTVGSWRQDGTTSNGWEWVELDGEHIQFISDAKNDEPTIPASLPHASCPAKRDLKPVTLRTQFQSPYKGAAGVIDIRGGRLDACETNTIDTASRVDTRLFLKSENAIVIVGKKPGERAKTIALDSDAVVFVANVPPPMLKTGIQPMQGDSEPHWNAYNDMLDGSCDGPPIVDAKVTFKSCDLFLSDAYKKARKSLPEYLRIINSECSNAQTP